jgi:hypothetical protein
MDRAQALASRAGPGIESRRSDYRKSATSLHPRREVSPDSVDRSSVGLRARDWIPTRRGVEMSGGVSSISTTGGTPSRMGLLILTSSSISIVGSSPERSSYTTDIAAFVSAQDHFSRGNEYQFLHLERCSASRPLAPLTTGSSSPRKRSCPCCHAAITSDQVQEAHTGVRNQAVWDVEGSPFDSNLGRSNARRVYRPHHIAPERRPRDPPVTLGGCRACRIEAGSGV